MSKQTVIRLARTPAEREAAIEYISCHMWAKHGACPPPETTPPHLFVALEESTVVGSLGMLFGRRDVPLPIEEFFRFSPEKVPIPYVREQTVYYSRWNSSRRGIGPAIWLGASLHAAQCGIIYTAQTIKDGMIERYAAFGCTWYKIPDTEVRRENIGESEKSYFLADSRPYPWLGMLREQIRELPAIVEIIRARTPILFETSD